MSSRKPQSLMDAETARRAAVPQHPWDYPATCEICESPRDCFEGRVPCALCGEFLRAVPDKKPSGSVVYTISKGADVLFSKKFYAWLKKLLYKRPDNH